MSLSMYQLSVPVFLRGLGLASGYCPKASVFRSESGLTPSTLIDARLTPDMLPFAAQTQRISDASKGPIARLAAVVPLRYEATESTFPELQLRIEKTSEFLKSINPTQLESAETGTVEAGFPWGGAEHLYGDTYLVRCALPTFYSYLSTAHDILQHMGVLIGKQDYLFLPEEAPIRRCLFYWLSSHSSHAARPADMVCGTTAPSSSRNPATSSAAITGQKRSTRAGSPASRVSGMLRSSRTQIARAKGSILSCRVGVYVAIITFATLIVFPRLYNKWATMTSKNERLKRREFFAADLGPYRAGTCDQTPIVAVVRAHRSAARSAPKPCNLRITAIPNRLGSRSLNRRMIAPVYSGTRRTTDAKRDLSVGFFGAINVEARPARA